MKKERIFWTLYGFNFVAFVLSLLFLKNHLSIMFVFSLPPLLFLFFKNRKIIKKSFVASIVVSIPFTLILGYYAYADKVWAVPHWSNIKVLGGLYIEDFIWQIIYMMHIVAFYEFFFDTDKGRGTYPKIFKWVIYLGFSIAFFFFSLIHLTVLGDVVIPYWGIIMSLLFLVLFPAITILRHRKLFNGIVKTGIFFFTYHILYEFVAVTNGAWHFPGEHYVGWVHLGNIKFTIEELLWLIFCTPAILCYYELFCDDGK